MLLLCACSSSNDYHNPVRKTGHTTFLNEKSAISEQQGENLNNDINSSLTGELLLLTFTQFDPKAVIVSVKLDTGVANSAVPVSLDQDALDGILWLEPVPGSRRLLRLFAEQGKVRRVQALQRDGRLLFDISLPTGRVTSGPLLSPDAEYLLSVLDGTRYVIQDKTGKVALEASIKSINQLIWLDETVLLAASETEKSLSTRSVVDGNVLDTLNLPLSPTDRIVELAASSDRRRAMISVYDSQTLSSRLLLWERETNELSTVAESVVGAGRFESLSWADRDQFILVRTGTGIDNESGIGTSPNRLTEGKTFPPRLIALPLKDGSAHFVGAPGEDSASVVTIQHRQFGFHDLLAGKPVSDEEAKHRQLSDRFDFYKIIWQPSP